MNTPELIEMLDTRKLWLTDPQTRAMIEEARRHLEGYVQLRKDYEALRKASY